MDSREEIAQGILQRQRHRQRTNAERRQERRDLDAKVVEDNDVRGV